MQSLGDKCVLHPVLLPSVDVVSGLLTEWELQVFLFFNGPELREVTQLQSQGGRKCGCLERRLNRSGEWAALSLVGAGGDGAAPGYRGESPLRLQLVVEATNHKGCAGKEPVQVGHPGRFRNCVESIDGEMTESHPSTRWWVETVGR